jgi:toxin YhaV
LQIGEVNGWLLLGDPLFESALTELENEVSRLRDKDPVNYKNKNATKRLAAITRLIGEVIPADPSAREFRLGATLGPEFKHWRRAKFFQQYRLFFRYDSTTRIIIFSWINDAATKRAYESKNDAYAVFLKKLESGNPPTTWSELLESVS